MDDDGGPRVVSHSDLDDPGIVSGNIIPDTGLNMFIGVHSNRI
jgi:hypothetical protein